MPNITVEQDPTDGNYYWKLNGEWIKDSKGDRIQANGTTPQVRINPETNEWEINSGDGWKPTGVTATGKDGADGKTSVRVVSVDFDECWALLDIPGQGTVKVTINIPNS